MHIILRHDITSLSLSVFLHLPLSRAITLTRLLSQGLTTSDEGATLVPALLCLSPSLSLCASLSLSP